MKKQLTLFFCITFLPTLYAQDSSRQLMRPALVKTNLLGPFSLFLEIPTAPRQSLQFSAQRVNFVFFGTTRIFSLTPEYRFYLSKRQPSARRPAPKGFYVSPYLKFWTVVDEPRGLFASSSRTYGEVSYSMFGGGVVVGLQFINRWGFTLDGFLGGGYFPVMSYRATTFNSAYSLPQPHPQDYRADVRVGLCIGLAFSQPRMVPDSRYQSIRPDRRAN